MSLEEENEKYDILDNHKRQIEQDGYKKYVISIKKEYINLIDSMSIDERNKTINDIIGYHNDSVVEKRQVKQLTKGILIGILVLVILIFFIPCVIGLINISFSLTQNNYAEMQNNFEVLYQKKK